RPCPAPRGIPRAPAPSPSAGASSRRHGPYTFSAIAAHLSRSVPGSGDLVPNLPQAPPLPWDRIGTPQPLGHGDGFRMLLYDNPPNSPRVTCEAVATPAKYRTVG